MTDKGTIGIVINDIISEMPHGITVAKMLFILNERDPHMIVELNGRLVYPGNYSSTVLRAGDRLELINPDFGG